MENQEKKTNTLLDPDQMFEELEKKIKELEKGHMQLFN